MPFNKFRDYLKAEGFCCPWACLRSRESWNTKSLAEDAECSRRAIRFWRESYNEGEVKCEHLPSCLKERRKTP